MIESISGKVRGFYLRRTRSGTLAVAPAFTIRAPSSGQLAQRDLFRRASQAQGQPILALADHWRHYADAAGLTVRQYYLSTQIAGERTHGLSPVLTEAGGPPAPSIIAAFGQPPSGTIILVFDPTSAPDVYKCHLWLKEYLGPGLLHDTHLMTDPSWWGWSTSGVVAAFDLKPGTDYTAVISFIDTDPDVAGPSALASATAWS